MAYVSLADFQQYVNAKDQERATITQRLDELQQGIIQLRGQTAVFETQTDEARKKMIDACDVRMTAIEVRGNQMIADVQVSQIAAGILQANLGTFAAAESE